MKKILTVMLIAVFALGFVCTYAEPMAGGWNVSESIEVTDELKALFDKAMESLVGVDYEPLAYLGYQIVSGTNHCFLCSATVVYPGAQPAYKLVYIYQDLAGNAEITAIADLELAEFFGTAAE